MEICVTEKGFRGDEIPAPQESEKSILRLFAQVFPKARNQRRSAGLSSNQKSKISKMGIQIASGIEHYTFKPEDISIPEFIVLEFTGHEGISQLTHFDIKLLNTDLDLDFSKLLNKRASLRIWCWQDDDYTRVYHGIISSLRHIGQNKVGQQEYAMFQAELVPLLWRATLSYRCHIYQEMSVRDIIEDILADTGLRADDYDISSLQGTYETLNQPPREFCVQYRETNFHFLSRLMEEEGMFYFFEYGPNKEKLIIGDANSVFGENAPASEARYEVPAGLQAAEEEYVHPLSYTQNVISAAFGLKDFSYNTPSTDLYSFSHIDQTDRYEVYDYPGHFGVLDRGSTLARIRNEESEVGRKLILGGSNCRSFCAGYKFTLVDPPRGDLGGEYLLTRASHHGIQTGPMATDSKISYENQFECIPSDVPYRPPRVTTKARVQGTQTATVTGPTDRDLYMDDKGRAKVKFHWDLETVKLPHYKILTQFSIHFGERVEKGRNRSVSAP